MSSLQGTRLPSYSLEDNAAQRNQACLEEAAAGQEGLFLQCAAHNAQAGLAAHFLAF